MKKFEFTISGNKYEVEFKMFEENIAEIEVNGTHYTVEVHREIKTTKTPKLVRSEVITTRAESKIRKTLASATLSITAPLPGTVIQVFVREGETVKKGDKLLTYEAMKMENSVLAEKDGTIRTIKVTTGQSILQGDVLMEIA
ncbi:MAG: biotin/lipoyl-containing protein [Bacteroidales bacterium]|nr:biotin/lipoyl-containing protein [Bacteroidales bacterium]MDZ4205484.1 biotin/lipoyl-containing protein [Bacteroidales bacterium]